MHHNYLYGDDQDWVRIRSEEFEDLLHSVLYAVGNIPRRNVLMPGLRHWHEAHGDPERQELVAGVWGLMPEFLELALAEAKASGSKTLDPTPFVKAAERAHGVDGALLALELLDDLSLMQHASPWWRFREWLDALYGRFVDQRYIDYLHRNYGDIDRMNWRKFEGLTAEFFSRLGFGVEIGPGRNDDGVDVRIWADGGDAAGPPTTSRAVQATEGQDRKGRCEGTLG